MCDVGGAGWFRWPAPARPIRSASAIRPATDLGSGRGARPATLLGSGVLRTEAAARAMPRDPRAAGDPETAGAVHELATTVIVAFTEFPIPNPNSTRSSAAAPRAECRCRRPADQHDLGRRGRRLHRGGHPAADARRRHRACRTGTCCCRCCGACGHRCPSRFRPQQIQSAFGEAVKHDRWHNSVYPR
jgi:hypothetical protein